MSSNENSEQSTSGQVSRSVRVSDRPNNNRQEPEQPPTRRPGSSKPNHEWHKIPPGKVRLPCPWELGQRVVACDVKGNWYPAKVIEIAVTQFKIHFQRWNSRYDQWFDMNTDLVREMEDSNESDENLTFQIMEEVLARWTDAKYYPAKIVTIYSDQQYCNVIFYDGYKKKVKLSTLQKLPQNYEGEKFPPVKPLPAPVDPGKDHNEFVCDICKKGFRKEVLLFQHRKHYHNIKDDNCPLSPFIFKSTKSLVSSEGGKSAVAGSSKPTVVKSEPTGETTTQVTVVPEKSVSGTSTAVVGGEATTPTTSETSKKRKSKRLESSGALVEKKARTEQEDGGLSVPVPKVVEIHGSKPRSTPPPPPPPKIPVGSSSKPVGEAPPLPKPVVSVTVPIPKRFPPRVNLILPFVNAKAVAEAHDNDNIEEFVKCVCPIREETGLMVQCELCLAWQHAFCMGFRDEDEVPADGYFCPFCRKAPKAIRSQRNAYQLNHWLRGGVEPFFQLDNFQPLNPTLDINQIRQVKCEVSIGAEDETPLRPLFDPMQPSTSTTSSSDPFLSEHKELEDEDGEMSDGVPKKSFVLHDLSVHQTSVTSHQTLNGGDHLNHDDHDDGLMDLGHTEDFYTNETKLVDEDEEHRIRIKAANQLSAALIDVMENLHSLNFAIKNEGDTLFDEISARQRMLRENLEAILGKVEKMEKEIDSHDDSANSTTSTLTATSPENFSGYCDTYTSGQISTPNHHRSHLTPLLDSNSQSTSSDYLNPNPFASTSTPLPHPHSHSHPPMTYDPNPTLSALNSTPDNSNALMQLSAKLLGTTPVPKLDETISPDNNSTTLNNNSTTIDEPELITAGEKLTMRHDYLPPTFSDGDIKLELACKFRDLAAAREIVLSLD